jgi:selenide,water dikinase
MEPGVPTAVADAIHDPQTSGGLMIALEGERAKELVSVLRAEGHPDVCIVGEFTAEHAGRILVRG